MGVGLSMLSSGQDTDCSRCPAGRCPLGSPFIMHPGGHPEARPGGDGGQPNGWEDFENGMSGPLVVLGWASGDVSSSHPLVSPFMTLDGLFILHLSFLDLTVSGLSGGI